MVKITFVYPDFESLGIESLMSVCTAAGFEVELVYYDAQNDFLGSRKSQVDYPAVATRIVATRPDLVAFSCVTDNFQFQIQCARELKAIDPKISTVFGGVHVTAVPQKVIAYPEVDGIAIGEAEISFIEFINACQINRGFIFPDHAVAGMVHKRNGKVIGAFNEGPIPDLERLPVPQKDHFYKRQTGHAREYLILTSRGCPYRCAYCFNSSVARTQAKHPVRQISVAKAIAELVAAKERYHPEFINVVDDCFTYQQEWLLNFCEEYKKQIGIPFACVTSPFHINEEKVRALHQAGCVYVQIGVQSLSEELCRTVISRPSSNAKIITAIDLLKKYKILIQVDHILGIPGDSIVEQEKAIEFYARHRPDIISVFWLTYYPSTAIVQQLKQTNELHAEDIAKIEDGISLTGKTFFTGGSFKNADRYYCIAFLLNWLPVLPSVAVRFLVATGIYRVFSIKNFVMSVALPRFLRAIFNHKDVRARSHIKRFLLKPLESLRKTQLRA